MRRRQTCGQIFWKPRGFRVLGGITLNPQPLNPKVGGPCFGFRASGLREAQSFGLRNFGLAAYFKGTPYILKSKIGSHELRGEGLKALGMGLFCTALFNPEPSYNPLCHRTERQLGGSWYLLTNYDCTYNPLEGPNMCSFKYSYNWVSKYHAPPSIQTPRVHAMQIPKAPAGSSNKR